MKVFVSSVVSGYEDFREAAKQAIEALQHLPVVMNRTHESSPDSPRKACLEEVAESDVVVLLMGYRYGDILKSGKSATHEEWDHARSLNKDVLVFVENIDTRDERQGAFLKKVGDWLDGHFFVHYSKPIDLLPQIVKALTKLQTRSDDPGQDPAEKLPPNCRERLELLRELSPPAAANVLSLLSGPSSRTPGILSGHEKDPPSWLIDAGAVAWEVIGDYMDAYGIAGSDSIRQRAVEAGSSRSPLYRIEHAIETAERGDRTQAEATLAQVPDRYPLRAAAEAFIAGDMAAVVAAIEPEGLHQSEDRDLALCSVITLAKVHMHREEYDLATEVLRAANARFPDRAGLLLLQANTTLAMVTQVGLESTRSQDLFGDVVDLALRSRDRYRRWDGPSHRALAVATDALLALDDPQRVVDLASGPPDGEATASEAGASGVQRNLAHAYLMLGRPQDINALSLEGVDASEAARILALQADVLGDDAALSRMRRSLEHAEDEPSRLKALFGLALMGEADEASFEGVPEAETALFAGVAAFIRGDLPEAIQILTPYRFESPIHAHYLAQAQYQTGATGEAVKTLTNASEHLGALLLLEPAADMLFEQGQFDDATAMATEVLAMGPSRALQKRMKVLLVEIAQQLQDWRNMESYAQSLVREFPDDNRAPWMVVYAMHRQSKNRHAWAYLAGRKLTPFSEETAQLAVAVCGSVDAPEQDAGRLLEIADMYPESEQVVGSAIVTLLAQGDRTIVSNDQLSRFHELTEDFIARYPQSDVFRAYSAKQPEELLDIMVAPLRSPPEQYVELINQVRYGQLPYGTLLFARPDLPYTDVLLSVAADWLTAIPADVEQNARERNAAKTALGGDVAVDTSVVALGISSGLGIHQFGSVFNTVLVADELVIDARWAVSIAHTPVAAILGYDPVLERPIITEIDEVQRNARLQKAESALETMDAWQSVKSGPLRLRSDPDEDGLRPWDAAIRVASSVENCALWCDDLALRAWAQAEGIPAFGTWALYEALAETPQPRWLPPATELKMRLLRARIADVPISLLELTQAIDDSDGPDTAVASLLGRPQIWYEYLTEALRWYTARLKELASGPHRQWVPIFVKESCRGIGTAVPPPNRLKAIGGILASALFNIGDPAIVPALVAGSRYATNDLDPSAELDPLPDAVEILLTSLEAEIGAEAARRDLMRLFSAADPADRLIVTSVILRDR